MSAAVAGGFVIFLLILGFWKMVELLYYLYYRIFRREDYRLLQKIKRAKRSGK